VTLKNLRKGGAKNLQMKIENVDYTNTGCRKINVFQVGGLVGKTQESRKNKIKNIGGVFTKIYGSEGSNFSSCFLQIKNING
jgi:hypothetical protein